MTSIWSQVTAWPNNLHEHATYLSKHLGEALLCIETAKAQPIPIPFAKSMTAAMSIVLTKIEKAPDYTTFLASKASGRFEGTRTTGDPNCT
jgi:hypothetical protein